MTYTLIQILTLLTAHFIADFICQSDRMAQGKSKSFLILGEHVLAYMIVLAAFASLLLPLQIAVIYVCINGFLHYGVDTVTSRINSRLWQQKKVHWFFVGIGFDQLIHYICLLLTFGWLS